MAVLGTGQVGVSYHSTIDYYGDVDQIYYNLLPGVKYEATVTGANYAATNVQAPIVVISDTNNNIIANSYQPGENPYIGPFGENTVDFTVPVAGTYVLNILDAAGTGEYKTDIGAYLSDPFTGFL